MSTSASPARVGRRCSLCSHPERAAIEAELSSGITSFRGIAGRIGISPESVRRHVTGHVALSVQRAMAEVTGHPALSMAQRLIEVADAARATRLRAEVAGDAKTALTAGQAEARVIHTLLPLDTLSEDIAGALQEAHDALSALATTVRAHPETGAVIAAVLDERGRADWADHIRKLASPHDEIEVSA